MKKLVAAIAAAAPDIPHEERGPITSPPRRDRVSPLVAVPEIKQEHPWWPYNADGTYRLIKLKRLGCVRVGRNVYVTDELLRAFVAKHTVQP